MWQNHGHYNTCSRNVPTWDHGSVHLSFSTEISPHPQLQICYATSRFNLPSHTRLSRTPIRAQPKHSHSLSSICVVQLSSLPLFLGWSRAMAAHSQYSARLASLSVSMATAETLLAPSTSLSVLMAMATILLVLSSP